MTIDDSPVVCSPLAEVLTTGRAGWARTGRVGSGGRDGRELPERMQAHLLRVMAAR